MNQPGATGGDQTTRHVRSAVVGDPEATAWIVERFSPPLRQMILRRLGPSGEAGLDSAVEDVVADVWLWALPRLGNIRPSERDGRYTPALMKYLAMRALGAANDLLERRLRRGRREEPLKDDAAMSAETEQPLVRAVRDAMSEASARELRAKFDAALAALDAESREIVILRGFEGLTNVEAAEELGQKPNTVAQRFKRALERLRKLLPASIFDELEDG